MKRLTLEQILALYPEALIFNMLDIRLRKDRHEALKDLAGAYILFCHLQILRRPAAATLQLQVAYWNCKQALGRPKVNGVLSLWLCNIPVPLAALLSPSFYPGQNAWVNQALPLV